MAKAQVTVPLDISDVRVLKTEMNKEGELIITIESTKVGTTCRVCGRWISKSHGHADWVTVHHLPVIGRPTYLRYRPTRYQCQECAGHPTSVQQLEWHDPNSRCTFVYEEHLLLQLVGSTVSDVSPVGPFLVADYVNDPNRVGMALGWLGSIYAICQFITAPWLVAIT
jgi:transposase